MSYPSPPLSLRRRPQLPDTYGNFAASMLSLFSSMLGNFDLTIYDGLPPAQVGRGLGKEGLGGRGGAKGRAGEGAVMGGG